MHSSNAGKVQSPVLQKPKLDPWSAGCQSQHCCLWKLRDISGNIWTAEQNALVTYGLQNKMLSNGTYVLQSEHPSDRQKGAVWTGPENSLALVASPWENVFTINITWEANSAWPWKLLKDFSVKRALRSSQTAKFVNHILSPPVPVNSKAYAL